MATWTPLRTLHGHRSVVHSVAFGAAGDVLVSAAHDQTVRVWDTATGECLRIDACRMADGDAFGIAVIERQIQQDQVAQPVFASPLAGHAPVAQGQHGITNPQQALTIALDDLDALFMQTCEQAFSDTEVAFHSANLDFRSAADFSGVRALRTLGIAVETLAAFAPQAPAVHQLFLDQ